MLLEAVVSCIIKNAGASEGTTCCVGGLPCAVPAVAATPNFTYALTPPANATDTSYAITATGQNALQAGSTITVIRSPAVFPVLSTVITCAGTSELISAC